MLRFGLRRAGAPGEWIDVGLHPAAAAQLRAITGGDETVPTVVAGSQALVNPLPAGRRGRAPNPAGPIHRPGSPGPIMERSRDPGASPSAIITVRADH